MLGAGTHGHCYLQVSYGNPLAQRATDTCPRPHSEMTAWFRHMGECPPPHPSFPLDGYPVELHLRHAHSRWGPYRVCPHLWVSALTAPWNYLVKTDAQVFPDLARWKEAQCMSGSWSGTSHGQPGCETLVEWPHSPSDCCVTFSKLDCLSELRLSHLSNESIVLNTTYVLSPFRYSD